MYYIRSKHSTIIISIFVIFFFQGCLDSFKSLETTIVGDISVVDSNDQAGANYVMIMSNDSTSHDQLIDDYIVDVYGDKYTLFVKALDHQNCDHVYFTVSHNNGHRPASVQKVDSVVYKNGLIKLVKKYEFHTDHLKCP